VRINEDVANKKLISLTSVTKFKKWKLFIQDANESTKLEEQNLHLRLLGNRNIKLGNGLREEER
jgi:hypothetical protein